MKSVLSSLVCLAAAGFGTSARATSLQEVETAFSRAVTYYCANAIDSDVAVDRLKPDSVVSLVPITSDEAKAALKLGPADKAWYASPAIGVVTVVQRPSACAVSAQGVQVADTLDRMVGPILTSTLNMHPQSLPSEVGAVRRLYVMANPPGPMVIYLTGRDDPALKTQYHGQVAAVVSRLGPSYRPGPF